LKVVTSENEKLQITARSEIELLKVDIEQLASRLSCSTSQLEEVTQELEREKSVCQLLKQQLIEKNDHCDKLAAHVKTLNVQLESLQLKHTGC
jgi:chromosome segregation ATPase